MALLNAEDRAAQLQLLNWRAHPARMAVEAFGFVPDRWQEEAFRLFPSQDKFRLALQACSGPGKSAVMAICGWNFVTCYHDGDQHPNGAVVSVTGDNLKNGLWKELAVWHGRSPLMQSQFEWTQERIYHREYPATWFLSARSFSKTANAEEQGRTLSGLHSPFILYLIDESGDISPNVLRSAEQGLTSCRWGKIVTSGNPTGLGGLLHFAVTQQSDLWDVVIITGDPDDPNRSPRVSIEWARQQIAQYGRDNPWVMSFILGKFPPQGVNSLLGTDDVRAAMGRHLTEDQYEFAQKRLGIDVARFGDDKTVLFPRQGLAAFTPVEMRQARSEEIAARVAMARHKWDFEVGLIDSTGGYGAGTVDACRLGGIDLIEVNASSSADDPRYFNKRSEMHFRAAEWVKAGGALPPVPGLVRQATAATYYFDKGRLRVTEKDQIKTLLNGQSPDDWEALLQTFAIVEMPRQGLALAHAFPGGNVIKDWDTYST